MRYHRLMWRLCLRRQLEAAGVDPDLLACVVVGGSALIGFCAPMLKRKSEGRRAPRMIAVESAAAASMTKGVYTYGSVNRGGRLGLLERVYVLDADYVPPSLQAGGLRSKGVAAPLSHIVHHGLVEPVTVDEGAAMRAAVTFPRAEGIVPSPENAYTMKRIMDEALACREAGASCTLVFCLTGSGLLDLPAYQEALAVDAPDCHAKSSPVDR